ncbi:MAG: hypothetical protein CK429_23770 [Mycobacterium sp.]|nr:MAG: hypothetical protein CK429_23770 [Mycobacterium sp.]
MDSGVAGIAPLAVADRDAVQLAAVADQVGGGDATSIRSSYDTATWGGSPGSIANENVDDG